MRAWGITLLAGAVLSLVWLWVCPTFTVNGANHLVWMDFDHKSQMSVGYHFTDAVMFFAGEVALWAAAAGVCLLRRDIAALVAHLLPPPLPASPASLQEWR